MPVPDTLKITELFWSFQGEGCRFGVSSIFVRLSGCSLRCPYCDTPDSWQKEGESQTCAGLMGRIESIRLLHPGAQLVFTGGEPLEQNLQPIVALAKAAGFFLAVETNGTQYQDLDFDWWAVAPKRESDYFIHSGLIERINEIKLVVSDNLTTDGIKMIRDQVPKVPIFLQPDVHNNGLDAYKKAFALYKEAGAAGIEGVRAGMQLHRVYGVP